MKWLLELLSVADFISPTIGMAQDVAHAVTGKEGSMTIQVSKGDLSRAKKLLGNEVISSNTVAFDPTADITLKCYGGEDGYDSIRKAMEKLQSKGIEVGVYPPWA